MTESQIERPKKNKSATESGKNRRHPLKSQVVVEQVTGAIICTAHCQGRVHDFRLFKQSKVRPKAVVTCLADKGYQGIAQLHPHSRTPHKKPRKSYLSQLQKQQNRELARMRVICEHVNCKLKVFRILAERYRNRRRRFALRFNLSAGLYNYELSLPA